MRRMNRLLWLPLGVALVCTSCAPVDEPAPSQPAGPAPRGSSRVKESRRHKDVPQGLRERIDAALKHVRQRDLLTTHGFWTIFHGILGMGPQTSLLDPLTNQRVNALEYICKGGRVRGLQFIPTRDGLDVRTGPMFVGQGHQDQFVAEMAQWGLPAGTKFLVLGKEYTFADFIRHTQARASVNANQELSWAVLVIGQYLGTNISWTNNRGEQLRFEDMVRYELNQPIDTAACGGTHRLFGLTWVYHLHLRRGGKTEGVWKDVADRLKKYRQRARKYQNSDGSFSTRYLAGPGNARDVQLRIGTTGHVLEWLALALPDAELRAQWMQDAAGALALMILDSQNQPVESGALYHAAHGLKIYRDRVFGLEPGHPAAFLPLPPESLSGPEDRAR